MFIVLFVMFPLGFLAFFSLIYSCFSVSKQLIPNLYQKLFVCSRRRNCEEEEHAVLIGIAHKTSDFK